MRSSFKGTFQKYSCNSLGLGFTFQCVCDSLYFGVLNQYMDTMIDSINGLYGSTRPH